MTIIDTMNIKSTVNMVVHMILLMWTCSRLAAYLTVHVTCEHVAATSTNNLMFMSPTDKSMFVEN